MMGPMEPQRKRDDFDPKGNDGDFGHADDFGQPGQPGGPVPQPQWDGSPDPRPMHERGHGPEGDGDSGNLFRKYRGVWAVLITLITLLACWQLLQVALGMGI